MERIENFKKHKIDDLYSVVGGKTVSQSKDVATGKIVDKQYYNDEGCITKAKLWDNGVKYVGTYAGDCINGHTDNSGPIDGNKATREYLKNRTNSAY